jgi:hypothetical protein
VCDISGPSAEINLGALPTHGPERTRQIKHTYKIEEHRFESAQSSKLSLYGRPN